MATGGGSGTGTGGEGGLGGEGGQPEPPCEDEAVRCLPSVGVRERCAGGSWEREDFACAVSVRVENGSGYPCAVKADGRFACWGQDGFSMLPAAPTLPGKVVSVYGGANAILDWQGTLFLLENGELWEASSSGSVRRRYPGIVSFDSDYSMSGLCVVGESGGATCENPTALSAAIGSSTAHFTELSVSPLDVCVLDEQSVAHCGLFDLVGPYLEVAVGNFGCGLTLRGVIECAMWDSFELPFAPPEGVFTSLAMADETICGIRENGEIACTGYAAQSPVPPEGTYTSIDGGDRNLCAIHTDGSVRCFSAFGFAIESPDGW